MTGVSACLSGLISGSKDQMLRASSAVADPAPLRISSKDHPLVWEMIVG